MIGRVYAISPSQGDLWYLRVLLQNVKGACSFSELRTVNGQVHASYASACVALGLVEDDEEYVKCMEEGTRVLMPNRLRSLFVSILIHANPTNPARIWSLYKSSMADDLMRYVSSAYLAERKLYQKVDKLLQKEGRRFTDFIPDDNDALSLGEGEITYDYERELQLGQEMQKMLSDEQTIVVSHVLSALTGDTSTKCFSVDGPGGSGKTYIWRTLCHLIRGLRKNYVSCAYTAIAATLMPEGRTCHRTFGLPVAQLSSESNSSITASSINGKRLKTADVIIWDEAAMAPRFALEIADRKLREIMHCQVPFGGKLVLLGGDFRQILPIKKRSTPAETIDYAIYSSPLWSQFTKLALTRNLRARAGETEFVRFLRAVGDGSANDRNNCVSLPSECIVTTDLEQHIYGSYITNNNYRAMATSAILSAKHVGVNESNTKVLAMMQGICREYKSIDNADVAGSTDNTLIMPEYLNTIDEGGLPPHILKLKCNAIVMLLRNLSVDDGLCNGTRLLVIALYNHSVECEILTGIHAGERHLIPRINNTIEYQELFTLNRKQFPLKLAFALTINKSQGQTFECVGLNIEYDVFEHGQLYVALSRARSWNSIKVYLGALTQTAQQAIAEQAPVLTNNIVYKELYLRK